MMKLYSPSTSHLRRPLSSLFTAILTSDTNPPPSPPPLQTLLSQIKLLSKTPSNHSSSLTTLDSLLSNTHLFDSATSLVFIDYLSQIKKLGRAKTVISHLKSTGKVSDPFLYSLVFDFIVKDGTITDVDNVWAEICNGFVKSFDFSAYVIFVCKYGGIHEIKDVYERILISVGSVVERQSYVALCAALCSFDEGFLAKNVVREMYDKGMSVDNWTYFLMFKCFCRLGFFNEADLVLRKLVRNGFVIDICVFGTFLHGLCRSGKYREANKLFRRLITRGPVRGFDGRNMVLKEGRRAIFQLKCDGVVPEMMAYESYFRALCNADKLDEAEVLLKKMIITALPEICVYGSFIKALFRADRDEDAMKFFKNQRKKGLVRADEIGRYVIMELCGKGKADDALRLFEEIKTVVGFVNGSDICNSILSSYWEGSSVANVERFFEKWRLKEDKYGKLNVMTYTIMLSGYCSCNDVSKALVVFEEMLNSKMGVNGTAYEKIISLLCDCGRPDEAFQYLNDMIENGHFLFCKRWRALFQTILNTDKHCVLIASC